MERFPMLRLILRFGDAAVTFLALFIAALIGWDCWPDWGWVAGVAAIVVGAVIYVGGRACVELVRIVTEMLVPR